MMSSMLVLAASVDAHVADHAPLTASDWLVLALICSPIAALWIWGVLRIRQARVAVRAALGGSGFQIVGLKRRFFRIGPFLPGRLRSGVVYRITARDATGRERKGWAAWGRSWAFTQDKLELRWDD
jgi:hypothetical protein